MDTLNFQTIQQLPTVNPMDLLYNYIMNYLFSADILYLAISIFFAMEVIKYFSEETRYSFELNKRLYGIVTLLLLIGIKFILNNFTFGTAKIFMVLLTFNILPVFVLYNIFLKQFGEWLRKIVPLLLESLSNKIKKLFNVQ